MGVLFRVLMQRLGHFTFYVHGSDWGHVIGASLATLFPESVLGFHTNMVYSSSMLTRFKMMLGSIYPKFVVDSEHCSKVYPMRKHVAELLHETGYFHLHATKPDTIGVALQDSPIGLAAYILEKFSTWTNNEWRELSDGGLEKKYTLTNLLDNVMIYWITGAITTSVRLYSEAFSKKNPAAKLDRFPCVVPTAVSNFPKELVYVPEMLARDKFPNLVQFTHLPRGGHFPAFEEPQILADDMWDAFEQIERYITERYTQYR
ncbi:Epoxide hydrolase [Gryllus bimaculatus]|nr:Epoxide hydrolase [Gryllus bimaculatus]